MKMSLINKEKVLNGVGKAVDITNKTADKVEDFVKEKQIDKKIEGMAQTLEEEVNSDWDLMPCLKTILQIFRSKRH